MTATPRYRWNAVAGRWQRSDGPFVKPAVVRDALDTVLGGVGDEMAALSVQLRARQITLAAWQIGMGDLVRQAHRAAAYSSGGGPPLPPALNPVIGGRIAAQLRYLERFAVQIYTGAQPLDGTLAARARQYADQGRGTFEAVQRRLAQDRGAGYEKNERGKGDSCDDCIGASAQGWVPLGTLVAVGSRRCRGHCHCRLLFARTLPAAKAG